MNWLSELIYFNQGKCVNGEGLGTCVCKMVINPQSWSCKTLVCTSMHNYFDLWPQLRGDANNI